MGQHLDEKRFHVINRAVKLALKDHKYNARKLGKAFNVSHGTITRIRNAKTWPGFLALKASRQSSPKVSKVEKELATNLSQLEKAPTREEFKGEIKLLSERQTGLFNRVKNIENDKSERRMFIAAITISVLALIIAIIALAS